MDTSTAKGPASLTGGRLAAIGLAAGLLAGLFGVGGGVLIVPALALGGLSQRHATATSLGAVTIITIVGTAQFAVEGAVVWAGLVPIVAGGLVGAQLGAVAAHRVPDRPLRIVFIAVLLALAVRQLLSVSPVMSDVAPTLLDLGLLGLLGLVAGMASGLLGIGSGVLLVPGIGWLLGVSQTAAQGTSLAVMVPVTAIGALAHRRRGSGDLRASVIVGACGVTGSVVGAQSALRMDPDVLQDLFAGLLVVIALMMIRRMRSTA